jgi:hypothetical protein
MKSLSRFIPCLLIAESSRLVVTAINDESAGPGFHFTKGRRTIQNKSVEPIPVAPEKGRRAKSKSARRQRGHRKRRAQQLMDTHQIEEILGHPIGPNVHIEIIQGEPDSYNVGSSSAIPVSSWSGGAEAVEDSWGSSSLPDVINYPTYTPTTWGDSWGKSGKGTKSTSRSSKASTSDGKSNKGKSSKGWDDDWHGSMPPVVVIYSPTRTPSVSINAAAIPSQYPSEHPSLVPSRIANIVATPPSSQPSIDPSSDPSLQPSEMPSSHSSKTSFPSSVPSTVVASTQPTVLYNPSASPNASILPTEGTREPSGRPIGE